MSAFKALRDVSKNFEQDLRLVSSELFIAKVGESFENGIAKKLQDLSLYTSKLRLLQAKSIAATPQIQNQVTDEHTVISKYTDAVKCKLVEQHVVKAITHANAVKTLITANDSSLNPEMLERKEKIMEQLAKFKDKEMVLMQLDAVLMEREQQLEEVRRQWDEQLGRLRALREGVSETSQGASPNPLSIKLHKLEDKTRLMRALLARLGGARGAGYDWLADPHRRLRALQLARPA